MKTILASIGLAVVLAMPGAASADDCRTNCVAIFKFCKQGCIDNYRGALRRGCKRGCKIAKRASIHTCRHGDPQVCPPLQ